MVRSIFLYLIIGYGAVGLAAATGFYVDNGRGQTVRYKDVTLDDQQKVELEILTLLGLPERPKKSKHIHPPSLKKSAPRFLFDVYHWLQPGGGVGCVRLPRSVDHETLELSPADQKAIARSDVVMTFANKNQNKDHKVRHSKGYRMWFNLGRVKRQKLSLIMAVLRIHQSLGDQKWSEMRNYTVRVYSIGSKNQIELVATKYVTNHDQGWLEFRLSRLFHAWVHQNKPNLGLLIFAEADGHVVKLTDIGLAAPHNDPAHQPFMVGYFKGEQLVSSAAILKSHNRLKRSMARHRNPVTKRKNPLLLKSLVPRSCRIRTLFISFKSLGWNDWILAPEGYFASFCSGDCHFPLNAHMNATNHAIVQTLVHLTTPRKAPKPSCAPAKLYPISILYYQADNSVTMKKFKNMAVKSCGCQ